jgi:iron complex outermembrane receptor protein
MNTATRRWMALLFALVAAAARAPQAVAQEITDTRNLADLSIEELMNESVTSVSKREQKLSQVAAALFVINQEDIRRSGALNIPDLLRMVPGLDVAQINANTWAISARGFNHQFADTLLVLIDGRAVYQPTSRGVYWDTQDVPLEDIERIEVVRGPGATLWGSNAVNGVINVITKQAKDTQGVLATAGGGTHDRAFGTAQYGGKIGEDASYRVFTKYLDQSNLPDLTGQDSNDGWHLLHAGFRADGSATQNDSLTVQGDIYSGREGAVTGHIVSISPPVNVNAPLSTELSGGNILGRWNHVLSSRSDTTTQVYFDRYVRSSPIIQEVRNTADLDFQQHLALGSRQNLIWGAEYRRSADQLDGTIDEDFVPASRTLELFSTFAQDEITLRPERVFLTIGTKLEHSSFGGGVEVEPNIRLAWTPSARSTLWGSVAEAARTPSRADLGGDFTAAAFSLPDGTPATLSIDGSPQRKSEHLLATDLGYRLQASEWASVDLAMFFNSYSRLKSLEPGAPSFLLDPVPHLEIPLVYGNELHGTTQGLEVSAHFRVTDRWTLAPGYSFLLMHLHTDGTSQDNASAADIEGSNPRHQAQLRSSVTLPRGVAWDTNIYFVERLPAQLVPSYTRLDTHVSWRPVERLELSVVGQNLLKNLHLESNDTGTSVNSTQVQRSVYAKFTWTF